MIKFSTKNIEKINLLFLGIFFSFLFLSFSHTHQYELFTSSKVLPTHNHSEIVDLFLDSELNCTIQSFGNSIEVIGDIVFSGIITSIDRTFVNSYKFYHYSDFSSLKDLRAPPTYLV